jgi:hypothetical protein
LRKKTISELSTIKMETDNAKLNPALITSSPIIQRTSDFYDNIYDSISDMSFGGSTVADSEFVAQQIRKYESALATDQKQQNSAPVYNLRIDKVCNVEQFSGLIIM